MLSGHHNQLMRALRTLPTAQNNGYESNKSQVIKVTSSGIWTKSLLHVQLSQIFYVQISHELY